MKERETMNNEDFKRLLTIMKDEWDRLISTHLDNGKTFEQAVEMTTIAFDQFLKSRGHADAR